MEKDNRPVYQKINGELVQRPGNVRDPDRRYHAVAGPDGGYHLEFNDAEEKERDAEEAKWEAEKPQREAERKAQEVEAEKFRESIKYENRLVAFVDILGWTKAVRETASKPEQTQKLGLVLNIIRNLMQHNKELDKLAGEDTWPGDPQVTQFSDCLTISTLDDRDGKNQLIQILQLLSISLIHQGFLLRGGISVGELYHRDTIVFGSAFLNAYELESRGSIYPRIILDPILSKRWGQGDTYRNKDGSLIGQARTWRLSHDGFRFLDFLQILDGAPEFWDSPQMIEKNLAPLRTLLIEKLELYGSDVGIWPKYVWLANYFNDVCAEYKGHNIEPIEL